MELDDVRGRSFVLSHSSRLVSGVVLYDFGAPLPIFEGEEAVGVVRQIVLDTRVRQIRFAGVDWEVVRQGPLPRWFEYRLRFGGRAENLGTFSVGTGLATIDGVARYRLRSGFERGHWEGSEGVVMTAEKRKGGSVAVATVSCLEGEASQMAVLAVLTFALALDRRLFRREPG